MDSLEFALMFDALVDMTKDEGAKRALRAQRDECLRNVSAEMEHHARMSRWLFDELQKDVPVGTSLEIPLYYE